MARAAGAEHQRPWRLHPFLRVGGLTKLQHLALGSNKLSGPIPTSIGTCAGLVSIDLSDNELTQELPGDLTNLSELTSLDASQNRLTGPIPTNIGRGCCNLARLNLCDNKLRGPVPKSLGACNALELLNLASNKLTGSIPSSLGACKRIRRINLMSNCMEASVPPSLNDCTQLEIVDLRYCRPETDEERVDDTSPPAPAPAPAAPGRPSSPSTPLADTEALGSTLGTDPMAMPLLLLLLVSCLAPVSLRSNVSANASSASTAPCQATSGFPTKQSWQQLKLVLSWSIDCGCELEA
jgi:hypothetical protein